MIIKGAKRNIAAPKKVEVPAAAPKKEAKQQVIKPVIEPVVEKIIEEPVVPVHKRAKRIIEEIEQEVAEQE